MFFVLQQKLASLSEADRVCSLCLDEMDLQEKTQYHSGWKRIIPKAKKALVIMVIFYLYPMRMLPGDSRYNLALSLLKSDYCRQSYTASGPHVPMCSP